MSIIYANCALGIPSGMLFNHMNKKIKLLIDGFFQSSKVHLVLTGKLAEQMVFNFLQLAVSLLSVALVVKLVDTRDLKSLAVRGVPVQVRPGAPSLLSLLTHATSRVGFIIGIHKESIQRRVGRVAMQRIANPWTSVRLRDAPPFFCVFITSAAFPTKHFSCHRFSVIQCVFRYSR